MSTSLALPPIREDLKLHTGPPLENGSPTWSLHDPARNAFFRIGWREFEMLARWNRGDARAISHGVNQETTLRISAPDVIKFAHFLAQNSLTYPDTPAALQRLKAGMNRPRQGPLSYLLHHYLFFRIPLCRPDRFLAATLPAARALVHPVARLILLLAGICGVVMVLRQWDAFTHTFLYFFSTRGIVYYGMAIFISKLFHELGHAYTSRHYGLHVPTMGVAFLVLWPVLYSDNSEAWKLTSRRARMNIVAAGSMVELALALAATFLWSFLDDGPLKSACFILAAVTWVSTLMINLSPFLRFDGYYLLSDYLDVPNLHHRAGAMGTWFLRNALFGWQRPCPETLPPNKRIFLVLFAYATWIYRLVLFTGIAVLVYNICFKALGLILFAVEIAWFVIMPIAREMTAWWRERSAMKLNRHVGIGLLGLSLLIFLCSYPFATRIQVPALLKSGTSFRIYPPFSAQLAEVAVRDGQRVAAGDPLFRFTAPQLAFEAHQAAVAVSLHQSELERITVSSQNLEDIRVAQEKLAGALTTLAGCRSQQARLEITAPANGIVSLPDERIRPGGWISRHTLLAYLVDDSGIRVTGYADARMSDKLAAGDPARFLAESRDMPMVDCIVHRLDTVAAQMIEPYLASPHGGGIAAREVVSDLIPVKAVYRIIAKPERRRAAPNQVVRGVLRINGKPESLFSQAWRRVFSVLLKESGF